MAATRKTREREGTEPAEVEEAEETTKDQRNENLNADVDDILDEIDGVLEEDAESFVRGYIQKGGQAVMHRGFQYGTLDSWKTNLGRALSAVQKFLSHAGADHILQAAAAS